MSRPLRLEHSGAIWHVTSRGNEKRDVFRDDEDRLGFLDVLGRTVELFGWRLHAYVLMGNHYHLLVETPAPTLSRGMRQLNGVYTQRFNRRHGRTGHLFQGRFKAILVERDTHLLSLARYVVQNPVAAGLARATADWRWSSYRATAGLEKAPEWLETEWTLEQLAPVRREAVKRYRQLANDPKAAAYAPRKEVRGQVFLGSEAFLADVERRTSAAPDDAGRAEGPDRSAEHAMSPRRERLLGPLPVPALVEACASALGVPLAAAKESPRTHVGPRRLLAYALRRYARATLNEIAAVLEVGEAQASALARAGEEVFLSEPDLRRRLEEAVALRTG